MDKYMDARFDALEKALATCINSISSFNPSVSQAQDLLDANEELYAALAQLEIHQNNYRRIQQLQEETAALDRQIKDTYVLLWETRKEIKATPVTKAPQARPGHEFSYTDLLNYASRISHTSRPPPGVTNGIEVTSSDGSSPAVNDVSNPTANSQAAPNGAGPTTDTSTAAAASPSATQPQGTASNPTTALPAHMRAATNAREGHIHYPWPTEQQIRSGALATLQRLADRGINPKNYDPEEEERLKKEAELEKQRSAAAEEEARREKERAAAEQRRRERERVAREREAEMAARPPTNTAGPSGDAAAPAAAPKRQFQFAGGMDDDDDDED